MNNILGRLLKERDYFYSFSLPKFHFIFFFFLRKIEISFSFSEVSFTRAFDVSMDISDLAHSVSHERISIANIADGRMHPTSVEEGNRGLSRPTGTSGGPFTITALKQRDDVNKSPFKAPEDRSDLIEMVHHENDCLLFPSSSVRQVHQLRHEDQRWNEKELSMNFHDSIALHNSLYALGEGSPLEILPRHVGDNRSSPSILKVEQWEEDKKEMIHEKTSTLSLHSRAGSRRGNPKVASMDTASRLDHVSSLTSTARQTSVMPSMERQGGLQAGSLARLPSSFSDVYEEREEEDEVRPARLSRHIPLREGVDLSLSSFRLIEPAVSAARGSPYSLSSHGGTTGTGERAYGARLASRSAAPSLFPVSSGVTSITDSIISDDSSYAALVYREKLAEKLCGDDLGHPHWEHELGCGSPSSSQLSASSMMGPSSQHRGGDVLQFFPSSQGSQDGTSGRFLHHHGGARTGGESSLRLRALSRAMDSQGSTHNKRRVLAKHPFRVLEAPSFSAGFSQLIDWGCHNRIAVGMEDVLYVWNPEDGSSNKLVELKNNAKVQHVMWVQKCSFVALATSTGATKIFEGESGTYLRVLEPKDAEGEEVTALAIRGPMLAVSSDSPRGITRIYDLRIKHALVQTIESRKDCVTTLSYSPLEPHYLATGSADGSVSLWDGRRNITPRCVFERAHAGAVTALQWNPHRSHRLMSAGKDGVLCFLHICPRHSGELQQDDELTRVGVPPMGSVTRAHSTGYPITSAIWHPQSDEILTSHSGKGHLQLRRADNLRYLGMYSAVGTDAEISCLTLSPNTEHVCAIQADQTLKLWHAFNKPSLPNSPVKDDAHSPSKTIRHCDPCNP